MDGKLLQVPRERDKTFLYMPNPSIIHPRSVKIDHHLKLVDFYIQTGCPAHFLLEPKFGDYEPDAYLKDLKGNAICAEVQITPISNKRMQNKIEQFTSMYGKEHDARVLLLATNNDYTKIHVPKGFKLIKIPLPNEPYCV